MTILSTKLVSSLNNYNSITPIVVKDLVENGGRTAMAYCSAGEKTKKYEATEKFVEANMSSLLWYGAIPFTKKLFNATAFKAFGYNPDVSLEYLKNGEQNINSVLKKIDSGILPNTILQKGKSINVKDDLKKILAGSTKYKNIHILRMSISTIIPTLLSAFVLPKAIIALTQYKVNSDNKTCVPNNKQKRVHFDGFSNFINNKNNNKTVSFKSLKTTLLNKATSAQTSLLGDMVAVDLAISGSRIYYANKREKEALKDNKSKFAFAAGLEKLIREGGFLYLIYFGGNHIKNTVDKLTKNAFDPVVLEDKNFIKELKSNAFSKNPIKGLSEKEAIDYVDANINNDKNVFIKYAKKMNLIETVENSKGKVFRNPLKYINIENLTNQFDTMEGAAKTFLKEGKDNIEKYVLKKAKVKRLGIYGNLVASSFAVCYILPKITYGFRKWYTGNTEEPGIINVISSSTQGKSNTTLK